MTDELKPLLPCPCCNGTPSLMHGPGGDIWVKCPVCGLQTEMHPNNAAIAAWNRRVRPDIASIDSVSLMAESVRRGLAEVEPIGIPNWLRTIIELRISHLQESVDASDYDENKYAWNFGIEELQDILEYRREDAE